MSQIRIPARVLAMAESEIFELIPPRVISDIKREDPHPLFKAFVVSHEGEAQPKVVGFGRTIQHWFASAVRALTDKLLIGTRVFNRHDDDSNDHDGRVPVGEVIGKALKSINGYLSTVAVTYIYPAFRDLPFDVASIEADIRVPDDKVEFEVKEPHIDRVTGIALSNSAIDKPAFPGAMLLAALQAFAEKPNNKETKSMTQDELKKLISEAKLKPSDVFGASELKNDPYVTELVDDKTNNIRGYQMRKLQDAEEKAKALEAERESLKQKVSELTKTSLMVTGRETLAASLKERKLDGDAKFGKFISRVFEKSFAPADVATIKKDIDKFLDGQIDEYAELVGAKPQAGASGGGGSDDGDKKGVGADDKGTADGDLSDPEKNPLIPKLT